MMNSLWNQISTLQRWDYYFTDDVNTHAITYAFAQKQIRINIAQSIGFDTLQLTHLLESEVSTPIQDPVTSGPASSYTWWYL